MIDIVLPGVLGEIQEEIGLGGALRIAAARGGGPTYFCSPDRLTDDHWLVQAVGWAAARAVASRFSTRSGGQIHLPLGPAGSRGKLWAAIERGLSQGISAIALARMLGVDEKTIRRHRRGQNGPKRPREDNGQGSLF